MKNDVFSAELISGNITYLWLMWKIKDKQISLCSPGSKYQSVFISTRWKPGGGCVFWWCAFPFIVNLSQDWTHQLNISAAIYGTTFEKPVVLSAEFHTVVDSWPLWFYTLLLVTVVLSLDVFFYWHISKLLRAPAATREACQLYQCSSEEDYNIMSMAWADNTAYYCCLRTAVTFKHTVTEINCIWYKPR